MDDEGDDSYLDRQAQNQQDDEQAAQKKNGLIETLAARNEKLETELMEMRALVGRGGGAEGGVDGDSTALHYKSQLDALRQGSSELKSEFLRFVLKTRDAFKDGGNELPALETAGEISDEMCMKVLRAASKVVLKHAASSSSSSSSVGAVPDRGSPLGNKPGSSASSRRESSAPGASRAATPAHMQHEIHELHARIKGLEYELRLALGAAEDIRALKTKLMQLVERCRQEKEAKLRAEAESALEKKRKDMLTDHLEKLMTHLKHEAAAKIRAMEQLRLSERETVKTKEKCDLISRKSSAKDRLVLELREGSKILEDQLRLMDEKYLELRGKLDWARENGERKIRQAVNKAKELRVKFALLGHNTPLDKIPLPDIHGGASVGSFDGGDSVASSVASRKSTGSKKGQSKIMMSSTVSGPHDYNDVKQPTVEGVIDKIARKQGAKPSWSEEKLRDLVASR